MMDTKRRLQRAKGSFSERVAVTSSPLTEKVHRKGSGGSRGRGVGKTLDAVWREKRGELPLAPRICRQETPPFCLELRHPYFVGTSPTNAKAQSANFSHRSRWPEKRSAAPKFFLLLGTPIKDSPEMRFREAMHLSPPPSDPPAPNDTPTFWLGAFSEAWRVTVEETTKKMRQFDDLLIKKAAGVLPGSRARRGPGERGE